jgi:hypothetical protein
VDVAVLAVAADAVLDVDAVAVEAGVGPWLDERAGEVAEADDDHEGSRVEGKAFMSGGLL